MDNWWWSGELSFAEQRERVELKETLRAENHEQRLKHAEQLVDYSIEQRAQFRAALRRVMELEARDSLCQQQRSRQAMEWAAELRAELGLPEYDDAAG